MANEVGVMAVIRAARPKFRSAHDKVGFAVHAMFMNSGYSLTATGSQALSDTILTCPPSDEVGIKGWNQKVSPIYHPHFHSFPPHITIEKKIITFQLYFLLFTTYKSK
ncbi:hypothetical protein MKW94_005458 [Papaver nudicaule]|uniref:PI31 proteasome regulator N-terminal domain-containing protein n=1 Tax=Papaver nudicaule TaxID=74823 RepID=A0AA41RR64_PAPNU|nr:hypothetical protein [Papaver nudicaule]